VAEALTEFDGGGETLADNSSSIRLGGYTAEVETVATLTIWLSGIDPLIYPPGNSIENLFYTGVSRIRST
jgi:hypothetical protein